MTHLEILSNKFFQIRHGQNLFFVVLSDQDEIHAKEK